MVQKMAARTFRGGSGEYGTGCGQCHPPMPVTHHPPPMTTPHPLPRCAKRGTGCDPCACRRRSVQGARRSACGAACGRGSGRAALPGTTPAAGLRSGGRQSARPAHRVGCGWWFCRCASAHVCIAWVFDQDCSRSSLLGAPKRTTCTQQGGRGRVRVEGLILWLCFGSCLVSGYDQACSRPVLQGAPKRMICK